MKTIRNQQAVKINVWTGIGMVAKIMDMGVMEWYKERVTDEDRIYGSLKPCFLSSDPQAYERVEAEYANPIILEDGEHIILESNGKEYEVVNMMKWGPVCDPIHFRLIR